MRVTHEEAMTQMRERARQPTPMAIGREVVAPDLLRQAKLATEYVTGLPEWDVFLQRIQAFVNDERAVIAAMAENMPATMTSEQVLMAHRRILESKAKVEAWERVLALPKNLLSAASETATAA